MTNIRAGLAAAAMTGFAFMSAPAHAYEAPWCAVISMGFGDAYWDCRYASLEACRPNVLGGNRGFCNPNPRYAGPPPSRRRVVRHYY